MEVRKKDILVYLVILVYFSGNYTSMLPVIGPLLKVANNLIFLYLALIIFQRAVQYSTEVMYTKIALGFAVFTVSYQLICVYFGNTEMLLTSLKAIVVILWLDSEIVQDKSLMIGPIMLAFWTWCIADSIFTFMNPTGVTFSVGHEYLLGGKNNKIFYFFIAEFLAGVRYIKNCYYNTKSINFSLVWIGFTAILLANAVTIQSSTTAIVLILLLLYIVFQNVFNVLPLTKISIVIVIHAIIFVVLVFVREMFQDQLDLIMKTLFDKDATLTGRIYIWRAALLSIAQSPWIGHGIYKAQAAQLLSGYDYMWTMAHNQILELLMRGGVVLLVQWLNIIRMLGGKLKTFSESVFSKFSTYAMFAIFFFYQTEATLDKISFFVFILMYHVASYSEYDN